MRLAGVRMHVDRSSGDGWVNLTIRGSGSAIENAKQRIEGIVNPGLALAEPLTPELGSPHALPHGEMNAPVPELLVGASGSGKTDFRIEIELTNKDQVCATALSPSHLTLFSRLSTSLTPLTPFCFFSLALTGRCGNRGGWSYNQRDPLVSGRVHTGREGAG